MPLRGMKALGIINTLYVIKGHACSKLPYRNVDTQFKFNSKNIDADGTP